MESSFGHIQCLVLTPSLSIFTRSSSLLILSKYFKIIDKQYYMFLELIITFLTKYFFYIFQMGCCINQNQAEKEEEYNPKQKKTNWYQTTLEAIVNCCVGCGRCVKQCCCPQRQITQKEFAEALKINNYGNTCYLNTALQLLFSMKVLVEKLERKDKTNLPYHTNIINIYKSILESRSPKQDIRNLLRTIQTTNPHIKGHEQNDVLDIFNILIRGLQLQNSSLSALFTLKACYICQNCRDTSILTKQDVFLCPKQICFKCDQELVCTVKSSPSYLFIVSKLGTEPYLQRREYKDQKGRTISYSCISMANYYGNRTSGHYTALKQVQRGGQSAWLEISDNHLAYINDQKLRQCRPILSVYKKIEPASSYQK